MGALASHARMLEATRPDPFARRAALREINEPLQVGLIAVTVRQPDERLHAIVFADRALTEEEKAYLAACERAAGEE